MVPSSLPRSPMRPYTSAMERAVRRELEAQVGEERPRVDEAHEGAARLHEALVDEPGAARF